MNGVLSLAALILVGTWIFSELRTTDSIPFELDCDKDCKRRTKETRWRRWSAPISQPVEQSSSARKELQRTAPCTRLKLRKPDSPEFLGVDRGSGRC